MNEGILLNSLLESSSDIVWIKNTSLEYTHVSDTFLEAFEKTREEIIGKQRQEYRLFEFEDRIDDCEIIDKGIEVEDDELMIYKGKYQMFHVKRRAIKDEDDNIVGLLEQQLLIDMLKAPVMLLNLLWKIFLMELL